MASLGLSELRFLMPSLEHSCRTSLIPLGHFYPRPVLAFGYCRCLRLSVCVCVRPCVNHELVRAITHHPSQLGSPNLDHRCKRPWLRSLLFLGAIDLDLQGQIQLQSQNLPHFELVRAITHHPFELGPPNLDQRCKIPWLRSLLFWGFIELDMSNLTYFQNPVYLHPFCIFEIFVRPAKTDGTESVPHPKWLRTNVFAHSVVSWTVEQSGCIFSVTIAGFQGSSTRRLAMDF